MAKGHYLIPEVFGESQSDVNETELRRKFLVKFEYC
jgi:hypothetical protein